MAGMTDDFDPVGIAEISRRSNPPLTEQHVAWLLNTDVHPDAPAGVKLARGRVYQWAEVAPWLRAHARRSGPFAGMRAAPDQQPRGHGSSRQAPEPAAEAAELAEWVASGRAAKIRADAGLSLQTVAAGLGVSVSALWRWEHGKKAPSAVNAAAYHRLLTRLAAEHAA